MGRRIRWNARSAVLVSNHGHRGLPPRWICVQPRSDGCPHGSGNGFRASKLGHLGHFGIWRRRQRRWRLWRRRWRRFLKLKDAIAAWPVLRCAAPRAGHLVSDVILSEAKNLSVKNPERSEAERSYCRVASSSMRWATRRPPSVRCHSERSEESLRQKSRKVRSRALLLPRSQFLDALGHALAIPFVKAHSKKQTQGERDCFCHWAIAFSYALRRRARLGSREAEASTACKA